MVQAFPTVSPTGDTRVKFRVTRDMSFHSNYSLAMNKTRLHLWSRSGLKMCKCMCKCLLCLQLYVQAMCA